MNSKKIKKQIILVVCIIAIIIISAVLAYLTDTDKKTNKFTLGNVDIELQEPKWYSLDAEGNNEYDENEELVVVNDENGNKIPDFAEYIAPNQVVEKDPQVKNIGINDAYVYLRVQIPMKEVSILKEDGTSATEKTELFSYEINSENWTEIETARLELEDSMTYTYYYKKAEEVDGEGIVTRKANILKAGETTEKLFETVTFVNTTDVKTLDQTQNINVKAYAIQSDNLAEGTDIVTTEWVEDWKEDVLNDGIFRANIIPSVKEKGDDYITLTISATLNKPVSKYQYSIDNGRQRDGAFV